MNRVRICFLVPAFGLLGSSLLAQNDFPAGKEGEVYYCPRIDLNPAGEGGPLSVTLDGELDDAAWVRAAWQGWANEANRIPRDENASDQDNDLEWAALADQSWLYVAWRFTDDIMKIGEHSQCDVWQDDSIEIYIDAKNNGPDCTTGTDRCYDPDDAQITVGVDNDGKTNPDELVFGGVAGKGSCDFSGPHPELCRGVVQQVQNATGDYAGWQGEIAIALETMGNNNDGDPAWTVDPQNCKVIGWNIHTNDDDDSGDRDHKLMWSKKEIQESAWRNPGAFGKLIFFDPSQALPELVTPVQNLSCERQADGSVAATWTNPPDANPASPIRIEVDGQRLKDVPGTTTSLVLTEQEVPRDGKDHTVGVKNSPCSSPTECTMIQSPFDRCGGLRTWNILGAFTGSGGANPGEDILRQDFLTDGQATEQDFVWFPGAAIATDFSNQAASTGILGGPAGRNPEGIPTVFARTGLSARVSFVGSSAFGAIIENVMAYAQCYVIAENEMEVYLGISSDDSIQVILNGEEVWINNTARGGDTACAPLDITSRTNPPVTLKKGSNSLMVKVFNGCCDWDFALRFQDLDEKPVTAGLSTTLYPPGVCTVPPLAAARSFDPAEMVTVQGQERPKWSRCAEYDVTLAISDLRGAGAGPGCPEAPASVTLVERVPAGWTPSSPSGNGVVNGQAVTWTLQGDALAAGSVAYKVKAGEGNGSVIFRGKIVEAGSAVTQGFVTGGVSALFNPNDFTPEGFIQTLLLLGPYKQRIIGGGATPGETNIRKDFLTDGAGITEKNVMPRSGDTVNTKYSTAAYSIGLVPTPNAPALNPGGVPTWSEWRDVDDTIDFEHYYGGDINNIMMYAVFYVIAEDDLAGIQLGLSSDDSVQVLLDNQEVWIKNTARPFDPANFVRDTSLPFDLAAGLHKVMVKVFEGDGEHGFRLRFQVNDPIQGIDVPITEGIRICLEPDPAACPAPETGPCKPVGTPFRRGDVDNSGAVDISDPINELHSLFLGDFDITCQDAADFDDSGEVDISDAINSLLWQFASGSISPPPGPFNCGLDPTPDKTVPDIGCQAYTGPNCQ